MKKIILFVLLVVFVSPLFAQTFYLKMTGGLNVGIKSDNYYIWADQSVPDGDSLLVFYAQKATPYSLGGGKSIGGSLGVKILKNLDFEMGLHYSKSSQKDFTMTSDWELWYSYNVQMFYHYLLNAKSTTITPSFIFKYPLGANYFYSRFGLLFSNITMTRTFDHTLYNNLPFYYPSETIEATEEFEKTRSLGFIAGLGCEILLSDKFFFVADVSYNHLRCEPESSKLTKYKYMGNDELANMTVSEKEFEYVDYYETTENQDENQPTKESKVSYPFQHVTIQVGFKYVIHDVLKSKK